MNVERITKKTLSRMKVSKKKKILVALSGGKDSAVTAFLLKKFGYDVEGLYVDLCVGDYSKNCLNEIEKLCGDIGIKLYVYDLKKEQGHSMKDVWKKTKKRNLNNCAACGVVKKWVLNKKARELGFDFIATGHNIDDEVETFLINLLKGSLQLSLNTGFITQNSGDKKFVTRLKPLFYVSNKAVLNYARKNKLPFVEGKCPNAEESYRLEVRKWLVKNVNDEEKINLIKNLEGLQKRMKGDKEFKVGYCGVCGEPARRDVCKKCSLLNN